MKRRQIAADILLVLLTVAFCWIFVGQYGVFGAKVDWISQHSVIPDYFRQQFYETGELFPEFAMNIGGGQNIYNFAYYGLYSPVILISYLLPFVKMGDYLMTASILSLAAAVVLMYRWLMARKISREISFLTALLFLLAGPMILQSYSQIMFVNYMPFLCMAFWGVDRYFERKKPGLYAISVFLMIMTSFYFSIGGILALVLYGIHRYLEVEEFMTDRKEGQLTVRRFLEEGIRFLMPMFTAVMMSGILLVPTAMALMGRGGAKSEISLAELLVPGVEILRFVYSAYGVGMTTLVVTVLITGLTYKRRHERILTFGCVIVLTVPVFAYLLNGGLYIRDKAMIPFLPLLCYLIAGYLEKQKKGEISFWAGLIPYLLTLVILVCGREQISSSKYWKLILVDGIVMIICYLVFRFYRHCGREIKAVGKVKAGGHLMLGIPPLVMLVVFGYMFHSSAGRTVSDSFYDEVTDKKIGQAIEEVLAEETGFYRMEQIGTEEENAANLNRVWDIRQYVSSIYSSSYNSEYQEFRQNTFEVEEPFRNILMQSVSANPLFRKFMGVKYIISEEDVTGYELYKTLGDVKVYQCEDVSPIAYGTESMISEKEYRKLEFPYNQMALLSYAAVEKAVGREEKSAEEVKKRMDEKLHSVEFEIPEMDGEENRIEKTEKGYRVHLNEKIKTQMKLSGNGTIVFLQFRVKNHHPSRDAAIWVESERNKLTSKSHVYYNKNTTFTYVAALKEGQDEIEITLGEGDYEIQDVKCFLGSIEEQTKGDELYQSEFQVDRKETEGNRITGKIEMQNDGYFVTTIPYDQDFEVLVDGKKTECEKVNTAFLGFEMGKGKHEVEIIYHARGAGIGKLISLAGMLMFLIIRRKALRL